MQIDRSSLPRRAVSRTPRVYAPSKLIGLHPPLDRYHSHLHKRAHSSSRIPRQFRYYLSARLVRPPQFHTSLRSRRLPPLPPFPPSYPPLSKRPGPGFRRGVSNVCERDEMQTGAILFIVRPGFTHTGLRPVARAGTEWRQGRIFYLPCDWKSAHVINQMHLPGRVSGSFFRVYASREMSAFRRVPRVAQTPKAPDHPQRPLFSRTPRICNIYESALYTVLQCFASAALTFRFRIPYAYTKYRARKKY